MKKVVVAGAPGAGKSTFARELARLRGLHYEELDALYHGPGWTRRPSFQADLERFTGQEHWVTEWQYEEARPLLNGRADTLIWLDLPLFVVMNRVTRRTLRRWLLREALWAGNREQPLWRIFTDRSNMIRWSWASRNHVRDALPAVTQDHPDLRIIRLRSRAQVRRFLANASRP